ncbi:22717_t:CDS:2, partial [Cetraspora pellucida]
NKASVKTHMSRIYTLSDIGKGSKLGDIPSSRMELENQLAYKDNKCIQHDLKQSNNDKEKLSKHTYQLINKVKQMSSELDTLISQINQLQISNTKYGAKNIIRLKKIKLLQLMNKILNSKLASAQKDAFLTQKKIIKKESEIISLKSELTNIKNKLMNTIDELASKIKKIKYLDALRSVLQKTKDILDSVELKTHCSAIVMRGNEKNIQSEEQSFISNSRDTSESRPKGLLLCRPFKGDSLSYKSLAKYFKNKTLPIITNNQNLELLIQDITNKQNPESLIQDITNKQNPESLIQDITIKETICADKALVNDKYQISSFIKIVIISEGTNVPKPTINEQSKVNYRKKENFYPVYRKQNKATKHASSRCIGHPAMLWLFTKLVTGKSGTGKTNILRNLVLDDKAEYIYKKKKCGSRYIWYNDLIAFVKYIYGIIASNSRASYYENIKFSYISPEKIPSVKSFFPERSTVIIFEDLYVVPKSIQNRIISFFTHGCYQNISPMFTMQKYHHVPMIIHENFSYILMFNSGSSPQDVSKIVGQYTDDIKSASMVINSYLRKSEFIVFDLNRAENDPLAIWLRFDTPLDLQKEIKLHQKHKTKNVLPTEPMNSESEKSAM